MDYNQLAKQQDNIINESGGDNMKYDGTININIAELEAAKIAFDTNGKIYELLESANEQVENMTTVIYEEIQSLAYSELGKILEEISDSQRGLTNNFEDISATLGKYLKSRQEGITINNETQNIIVKKEIKDINNNLKRIDSDIQDVLREKFPVISSFMVIDDDKKQVIDAINSRIDGTQEIQNSKRKDIEAAIEEAKELCYAVEQWYEDDYNEGAAVAIGLSKLAVTTAIGVFSPVGLAVIVGTMAAREYYKEGYSSGEALTIGAASGAFSYIGDKVGGIVTQKCGEVLKTGVSSVSKYADDLIGKINLPTNLVRDRLESISGKGFAYQIYYQVIEITERTITIPGERFNSEMIDITVEVVKNREFRGIFITHDFAKMYDELLEKSANNLSKLHQSSRKVIENAAINLKEEHQMKILGTEINFAFSDYLIELATSTIEDSVNELVDNLSASVKHQLGIDDYTFEHSFRNELSKQVRRGLVSIAF